MVKEQWSVSEWTPSARAYQMAVNAVYELVHSIQDAKDLDEE